MVSICISLRTNDIKPLFMCLLAISLSFEESDCSCLLPFSQRGCMFYHWFVKLIYIIWVQVSYSYMICKYFPHSASSLFTFWMILFVADNDLKSDEVQYISFYLVPWPFGGISKKTLPHPMSWQFTALLSSKSSILVAHVFRSVIHFELIFVYGVK